MRVGSVGKRSGAHNRPVQPPGKANIGVCRIRADDDKPQRIQ
jgi:hypothetical protein